MPRLVLPGKQILINDLQILNRRSQKEKTNQKPKTELFVQVHIAGRAECIGIKTTRMC